MKAISNVAILLILFCCAFLAHAQSGPAAYEFSSLPPEVQVQAVQEAVVPDSTPAPSSIPALERVDAYDADRMALEYRITQERYRFYEVILLACVAVFALIVVLSFIRRSPRCQPRDMVNATGLILVIFSTIIIILLADVEVQLTAAMGVLGGIAGYLFGTFNMPRSSQQRGPEDPGERAPPRN